MFDTTTSAEVFVEDTVEYCNSVEAASNDRVVRRELAGCYRQYRGMALRRLHDQDAADDVIQAFALKALERSAQLRDVKAVHGWLRRLFETTLIDHCRRKTALRHRETTFELDIHDRPHETLTDCLPDPVGTVMDLMAHMKREYADVVRRLDLENQPKEEAAHDLGITLNNLTVRVHRARRALRDAIELTSVSRETSGLAKARGANAPIFALASA